MSTSKWIRVDNSLPKERELVNTKIDDEKGLRNEQPLKRIKDLWFVPDCSMYVYYTPTHWKLINYEQHQLGRI